MINFEQRLKKLKDRRQGALDRATVDRIIAMDYLGETSAYLDQRSVRKVAAEFCD